MHTLSNEETENMRLISREGREDGLSCKSDNDDTRTVKKDLSLKEAFYIMASFSMGVNMLMIPFTIRQLGLVTWIVCVTVIALVLTTCAYLLWWSIQHMLEENNERDVARDPYPSLANYSRGPIARSFAVVFLFASGWTMCVSFLLVAASILADLVPIDTFSRANLIRISSTIIVSVLTPITYLGTYSDVRLPAVIALVTSFVTAIAIFVNCMIYVSSTPGELTVENHKMSEQNFLVPIGTLVYAWGGATYGISNITVISSTPQKLPRCIIACNVCLFSVSLITGITPYLIFGESTLSSTTSTFSQVISGKHGSSVVFQGITILLQVVMLVHLAMIIILDMNPCFLYIEDLLNVTHEFNFKRVLIRTSIMLATLGICLLIPQFEFAVSIAGGVPIAFMCIFLPVLFYTGIIEMSIFKKILTFLILLVVVIFMLSNLTFSIIGL